MQRRRRSRKARSSNSTPSLLGKELRETDLALLGGNSSQAGANTSEAVADLLLCNLLSNYSISEVDDVSKRNPVIEESSTNSLASGVKQRQCTESSVKTKQQERNLEDEMLQATFVQQLVLSMIFCDS
eukprot:c20683_g1_i1 orf=514-897(+)